jgi:formylglycine-generating enzyme required for sulfatase activity
VGLNNTDLPAGNETYVSKGANHPIWSNNDDGNWPYSSPVGSFAPNGYGLYDMAGNMDEWCWDIPESYTAGSQQTNPHGAASGWGRVNRGGSWDSTAFHCRVAISFHQYRTDNYIDRGFRIARSSVP